MPAVSHIAASITSIARVPGSRPRYARAITITTAAIVIHGSASFIQNRRCVRGNPCGISHHHAAATVACPISTSSQKMCDCQRTFIGPWYFRSLDVPDIRIYRQERQGRQDRQEKQFNRFLLGGLGALGVLGGSFF